MRGWHNFSPSCFLNEYVFFLKKKPQNLQRSKSFFIMVCVILPSQPTGLLGDKSHPTGVPLGCQSGGGLSCSHAVRSRDPLLSVFSSELTSRGAFSHVGGGRDGGRALTCDHVRPVFSRLRRSQEPAHRPTRPAGTRTHLAGSDRWEGLAAQKSPALLTVRPPQTPASVTELHENKLEKGRLIFLFYLSFVWSVFRDKYRTFRTENK